MLPNLIIIGAAKCGTTSLHRYLALHPEIEMSPLKEPHFFSDMNWWRGLDWYERQFPAPAKIVGEASPSYTYYPRDPHVPERMAATVPDAKLIYLVRDPIERLVSNYRFRRYVLGHEVRPLEEALRDLAASAYVQTSCYAMQLEQFLPHYPLERILVLEQRALAERRLETLERVFSFLGVDEFTTKAMAQSYNETGVRPNQLGRSTLRLLETIAGPRRSFILRTRIPKPLKRPFMSRARAPRVTIPDELRNALVEHFRPDTERLRAYTGEAFSDWST